MKLEERASTQEEQLSKNKAKMKAMKVQLEQVRKTHRVKESEDETLKGRIEVQSGQTNKEHKQTKKQRHNGV